MTQSDTGRDVPCDDIDRQMRDMIEQLQIDVQKAARKEALAQIPKPQPKPRLKTLVDGAKKAGATSVTRDGVTYGVGSGAQVEPQTSPDDALAQWRKKHAR